MCAVDSACRTLTEFMSSGRVLAMELVAENAIAKWRKLIGEYKLLSPLPGYALPDLFHDSAAKGYCSIA